MAPAKSLRTVIDRMKVLQSTISLSVNLKEKCMVFAIGTWARQAVYQRARVLIAAVPTPETDNVTIKTFYQNLEPQMDDGAEHDGAVAVAQYLSTVRIDARKLVKALAYVFVTQESAICCA
jgi:hypothetical protein